MNRSNHFEGEITVSSRIVDYLSSGLYESPAACLKELVNNSYDADATLVEVFVKPDADRIIISDNGRGINRTEFQRHFTRISESHKRDDGDTTPQGRKKIGKIGIGFIAANEICDEMEIVSTKKGSSELLHVTIHFDKMRQDLDERRRKGDNIAKADYTGNVEQADIPAQYTRIFLKRVRGEAREILAGAGPTRPGGKARSLYGLSAESVRQILAEQNLPGWAEFDEYSRTLLRIGLNVPVPYHEDWMPTRELQRVSDLIKEVAALNFHVKYDGTELRKPIVLMPRNEPEGETCFVHRFSFKGSHVAARGYFYAQHGTVKPEELQGLLVRIRQAAVGGYDSTFLDFPATEGSLIQRWISAEIWADDRLEDAMNIDRRTLRVAHPAYVELQRAVHAELRAVISDARKRLYETRNVERRKARAAEAVSHLREVVRREIAPANASVAAVLDRTLRAAELRPEKSQLSRRLSVAEFYEIVVDVARETLPPRAFGEFMKRLTERLNE
ncbi:MAG: ATP-binding protein [Thermoanaerobaculia bacterium]